jgi:nucleoside phosphorylase
MTVAGVGPAKAESGVAALLAAFPVARVLGAGVAGGLSPGLATGDLMLAREVRAGDVPVAAPAEAWTQTALRGSSARAATVVTVDRLLPGAEEKAALFARLALSPPAVVDMESSGWARGAASRNVPYAVGRVVLDRAEDALPGFLVRCLGADGGLSRRRIAAHVVAHPGDLRVLVGLERRLRACLARLAPLVEAMVAAAP